MKRTKKRPQPNYVRKLRYLWRIGAIPRDVGVHLVDVAHDGWCGYFQGQRRNCDPDIRITDAPADRSVAWGVFACIGYP
jgi:hypothetical protein